MSGAALDMTLDDLIKNSKKSGASGGRGRPRASGPGPARRSTNRGSNRSAPYSTSKAPDAAWNHDMFSSDEAMANQGRYGGGGGRVSSIETGTKLYITNLDYGVSQDDIKELFAEVGDLKRAVVHYDKSGRSKGTAEVVYSRRPDALSAIKKYNNVQLDGKPMKIEIVGTNISTPATGAPSAIANFSGIPRSGQGKGGFGRSRVAAAGGGGGGGGRGLRGRGRGNGRGGRGEKLSSDDLDADLEKYHADAESMQIAD